ncbi:MAG: hypothetical protein HOW73_37800 [Polyangiaceae bacterium]|nr:hypothetical protein [Polyangiaceae bacterium]
MKPKKRASKQVSPQHAQTKIRRRPRPLPNGAELLSASIEAAPLGPSPLNAPALAFPVVAPYAQAPSRRWRVWPTAPPRARPAVVALGAISLAILAAMLVARLAVYFSTH